MTAVVLARHTPWFVGDWMNVSSLAVNCRTTAEERGTVPPRLPDFGGASAEGRPGNVPQNDHVAHVARESANHGRSPEPQLLNFNRWPRCSRRRLARGRLILLHSCYPPPPGAPDLPRVYALPRPVVSLSSGEAVRRPATLTPASLRGEQEHRVRGMILAHARARAWPTTGIMPFRIIHT